MSVSDFEECSDLLKSDKVTERKKYSAKLSTLLENNDFIKSLRNESTWNELVYSLQTCMKKDADKEIEDARKKSTSVSVSAKKTMFSSELLIQVIDIVIKEDIKINIKGLLGYIIGCMNDFKMKTCYEKELLIILQKSILSHPKSRGKLNKEDWSELYNFLKKLIEGKPDNTLVSNCFMLLIKWGPSSGLSPLILREDYEFMTKLCQKVNQNLPRLQQNDAIETALSFCEHTAKDNRISCCKFGEDVIVNLIDLYELNGKPERTKELLVEFFLLQMIIHHPNGVTQDHNAAYANNWTTWKKCLKTMYVLLSKEMNLYFKCNQKNTSFFIEDKGNMMLCVTFLKLFVEISRQLFNYPDLDVTITTSSLPPPQKRQKTEYIFGNYVEKIKNSKSWLWVNIVTSIMKTYPKIIEIEDYVSLLKILSSIQIESNEHNVIEHIYFCLSTMLHVEQTLVTTSHQDEIKKLWKCIGDSTMRAFGLNQHKEATEKLLEELISRGVIDFEKLLQTYQSGLISLSLQTIKTFDSGLRFMVLTDLKEKERIMRCILPSQNFKEYHYLCDKKTANFLVKLTFKQYKYEKTEDKNKKKVCYYDSLKDIYFKTLLDEDTLVLKKGEKTETLLNIPDKDLESCGLLIRVVEEFVKSGTETEEILFSKIILLANICSCLGEYNILTLEEIKHCQFINLIESILKKDNIKQFLLCQMGNERDVKRLIECISIVKILFSLEISKGVMDKLKDLIPIEFLRTLFKTLNNLQEDQKVKSSLFSELKVGVTQALSNFACICGNTLNQNQNFALELLARPNYNCNVTDDYILLTTFLKTLKLSEPGVLSDSILTNVLTCIQELASLRYTDKAEDILDILEGIYPHVAASTDNDNKSNYVLFLNVFYENIDNNGPEVSIGLLKCLQVLCKLDPQNNFSRWSNVEVIKFVPEFLKSNYQEVRLKAIDVIVTYYENNSKTNCIQDIHRQEEIIMKIYEMSLAAFQVSGILTNERRADEGLCRTASVSLTFVNIINSCDNWMEECLYYLMKVSHVRGIEQVDKAFNIINKKKLGSRDSIILEKYIPYLIEKWLNDGFKFDEFKYELFKCKTQNEFCEKYFKECAHLLIIKSQFTVTDLAGILNLTENKIIEETSTKIFSTVICSDLEHSGPSIFTENAILVKYSNIIGLVHLKQILIENMDQIVMGILDFLTDEIYIKCNLEEDVIFFNKYLNISEVHHCFQVVEIILCEEQPLGLVLTEFHWPKIENILLQLKLNIYKCIVDKDQLKCFHRYTCFIGFLTEYLKFDKVWRFYFIRDIIHTLLNLIENYENCSSMVNASCTFLGKFLEKILPDLSQTFSHFFYDTVNALKKIYLTRKVIAHKCNQILNFLIVNNQSQFKVEIKGLDAFSDNNDFNEIRLVQKQIRYADGELPLEGEINQFLNHQGMMTEEDSLVYLRKVLANKKDKLLKMYDELQEIKGFSEDCETSELHRLVCALSQLSYSTNQKISFESARCLGELGPANLQTLVLQPEKILVHTNHSPFQIVIGTAISVLSKYITDCDINVIQQASKMFYLVLNSEEGRKIVDASADFGFGPINKSYFIPYFPPTSTSPSQNVNIDIGYFLKNLHEENAWCPKKNICHKQWITHLVSYLLKSFTDQVFFEKFVEVCTVKLDFCEYLLPLIIDLMVFTENKKVVNLISEKMNNFFSMHWKLSKGTAKKDHIALNKRSVKTMLNVVNYVRTMEKSNTLRRGTHIKLSVDYLKLAKAAEFCANHFLALYYAELWCQNVIEKVQIQNNKYCEKRSSMIDNIYEIEETEFGEALHNILKNAYKSIGDFDALPGCGTSFLLLPRYRVEHYRELGKFDQVIQFHANQALEPGSSSKELVDSFKNYGFYQMPVICSHIEEPEYECLWRLSQWSFTEKKTSLDDNIINYEDFEKYRFSSLKALHNNNVSVFEESTKSQFLCLTNHLKNISLESSHNLYPVLTKLQSLVEMEDFSSSCKSSNLTSLIEKWKQQDMLIRTNDFQCVEPIITQRLVMLTDYLKKHNEENIRNYMIDLSLSFAGWAKDEGLCKDGFRILDSLKRISDLNDNTRHKIELLDAQLSWSVNNTTIARQLLNRLCKNEINLNKKLHSLALKLTGQYMSETHSENRSTITDYLLSSVQMMGSVEINEEDKHTVMDTYDKLAIFTDKEYQEIMTYMKSDLFQKKIANMEQAKKTAANLQKQKNKTTDERRAAAIHDRNSHIDDAEIRTARQESNQYLKIALKYYLLSLIHSDDNNIRIFRVIALFIENRKNKEIAATINDYLPKLPSYKFIITLPQLIPHLSQNDKDLFSDQVHKIIQKCALDHPHHTLPLLLALANAYEDREFDGSKTVTNDTRVITAKHLIATLKKDGLSNLINKLNLVSHALIDLAYSKNAEENNERKKEFNIPRNKKILSIRNYSDVLIPTSELAVSMTKNYTNIVGISSFKSTYQIVGGVNKPKKILCRGTDGIWYSQLVKGHDDLRQDAVMEQVFTIMNNLLSYNKSTKHLRIRTYKIVPLSMRSGVLKWADNSMPIGEYLTGSKDVQGAHQIYRPSDILHSTCREMFKKCATKTADFKLKTYKDICHHFKPVLHHFFEYHFIQPAVWYERRRAYIQSVATTSMCGYILGIGDRHTSNILIDKKTAEVIHIDFGIAFEQGRVLPTPETVPFRLTRDMVDGMGASGIEGIFRRSCEKTMDVLRQNEQTIITILEVLLYDPLYAWTVTSAEANKRQTDSDNSIRAETNNSSEESTNVSAERALLRLKEKLQGTELGYPRSIEHQVGILIQQAVDPENLCKLYVGWQPYV